jgi:hypothetical protein
MLSVWRGLLSFQVARLGLAVGKNFGPEAWVNLGHPLAGSALLEIATWGQQRAEEELSVQSPEIMHQRQPVTQREQVMNHGH